MSQHMFEQAVDLHGQGRVAEAERLYRLALAANPNLLDARHMLGVLKAQQGHNHEAHDLIAPLPEPALVSGTVLLAVKAYAPTETIAARITAPRPIVFLV